MPGKEVLVEVIKFASGASDFRIKYIYARIKTAAIDTNIMMFFIFGIFLFVQILIL
jgi:hypothetical protein